MGKTKSQVIVKACMTNNGVGVMTLHNSITWSGTIIGRNPPKIEIDRSANFNYKGVPPRDLEGSMGAVVYVGPKVQGGGDECAWVMAWSVPGDGKDNKIYVETGPSERYPKKDFQWDDIKEKLMKSETDCYSKPDHGAEASAEIDPTGNKPKASAIFYVNIDGN